MLSPYLLPAALVCHIAGLVMMAGTTLSDFIAFKQFWKHYPGNPVSTQGLQQTMSKFPMIMGLGVGLLILSGVAMMALTQGVFAEMRWFQVKLAVVMILILNGLLVGRKHGVKLHRLLTVADGHMSSELQQVKVNLRRFHIMQLTLFVIIIILSVFRFN